MKRKSEKKYKHLASFILCIFCFVAGVLVPVTYNSLISPDSSEWKKLEKVYSIMSENWYFGNDVDNLEDTLVEQAITGMTYFDVDPHTNYFNLEQAQQFSAALEGSNVGIGFTYYTDEDKNMVVKNVFVDSPADKAGFQSGDIVEEVDGLNCANEDIQTILDHIKEMAEKEIDVRILRNDQKKVISLTPTSYDSTVVCNIYDTYGEIILNSFSESSGKDFALSMERIQKAGLKKIIIDLRDNTGGYLKSVVDIASILLPKDSVVFSEEDKDGNKSEQKVSDAYSQIKMDQIIVLQNENTASASEVLIGALKAYLKDDVITIGVNTYGKGTEQVSIPFTDGTSLKYTCAKWYTPDGENINNEGFKPDVEVEQSEAASAKYTKMEEDTVIKKDAVHTNAQALQIYLKFLGYDVDREDTYFSIQSSKALELYQSEHNLSVTGDCDYDTWNSIVDTVLLKLNNQSYDYQRQKALDLIQ